MDGSIMAGTTTYFGISYPTNTDYVKDGANAIQTVASGFDSAVAIPTYNAQTGATYTFALTDVGKTVTASNASAQTYTIPPTASVAWPTNTTLNLVNLGAGAVTVAAGAGVTLANSTTKLNQYQSAILVRTALNTWSLVPFAGGALPLSDSAVTGTTGSPTTGTYTLSSVNYKYYQFTGTGSITFSTDGLVDVLCVGGGGGTNGAAQGGGAGGFIYQTDFSVTAATHTVTVGANATGAQRGGDSAFRSLTAVGGGRGGAAGLAIGQVGGSQGAPGPTTGTIVLNQGNLAGTGGGGGAGGATAGGVGTSNSITGSAVTYAVGGSSTTPVTATANTGNGAGGSATTNTSGSGVVIIRVRA